MAGYVGIAVENARLYRSLQRKVEEYERLKEFSENIVESINVGILAADLDDRVESWNAQIERLTGIPREQAVGRRLGELFPAELAAGFDEARGDTGVHHIYRFGAETAPAARREARKRERRPGPRRAPVHGQRGHRAAGLQGPRADRPAHHLRRHHRALGTRAAAGPGRQAQLHRPAGGRGGARGQHAAGGDFHLRPDARQAGFRRRPEVEAAGQDRQADLPGQRDRQFAAEFLAHLSDRVRRSQTSTR